MGVKAPTNVEGDKKGNRKPTKNRKPVKKVILSGLMKLIVLTLVLVVGFYGMKLYNQYTAAQFYTVYDGFAETKDEYNPAVRELSSNSRKVLPVIDKKANIIGVHELRKLHGLQTVKTVTPDIESQLYILHDIYFASEAEADIAREVYIKFYEEQAYTAKVNQNIIQLTKNFDEETFNTISLHVTPSIVEGLYRLNVQFISPEVPLSELPSLDGDYNEKDADTLFKKLDKKSSCDVRINSFVGNWLPEYECIEGTRYM